jgi:hypothetical protein
MAFNLCWDYLARLSNFLPAEVAGMQIPLSAFLSDYHRSFFEGKVGLVCVHMELLYTKSTPQAECLNGKHIVINLVAGHKLRRWLGSSRRCGGSDSLSLDNHAENLAAFPCSCPALSQIKLFVRFVHDELSFPAKA